MSSGAVAAGVAALGSAHARATCGRCRRCRRSARAGSCGVWNEELEAFGLIGAQVLVDPHDFVDRTQYLHARQTSARLLELGCVPIINENDAIANDELRYGDNDRIAALVAHSMKADVMVMLTDLDGLYTADPRIHPDAELVSRGRRRRSVAVDPCRCRWQWPRQRRDGEQAGRRPDRVVVGRAHGDRQCRP